MTIQATTATPANGSTSPHELFALTDEQILEIEPQAEVASGEWRVASEISAPDIAAKPDAKADSSPPLGTTNAPDGTSEPPAWLARQMKDPWVGEEARELWDGVLRAQAETAEYRAAIATPAEAMSLKEIYPGGINQARAAAERARALDEFDAAYFGAAGKSAEETSAARTALAQRMLREDPNAFREMVFAGLKALEESNVAPPLRAQAGFRAASATQAQPKDAGLKPGATNTSPAREQLGDGLKPAPTHTSQNHSAAHDAQLVAYSEFEKVANADLEKSVGGAIERALRQALPLAEQPAHANDSQAGVPTLQERLGGAVRQEIEKALQGDRQLGEQVAQVLSSRRFDESTRTQVVRLINERAQQLVPGATKRVLNDWTQTTLAAHRLSAVSRAGAKTEKQETASFFFTKDGRADLAPAQQGRESAATGRAQRPANRVAAAPPSRGRIDYKKLSDEQILEL